MLRKTQKEDRRLVEKRMKEKHLKRMNEMWAESKREKGIVEINVEQSGLFTKNNLLL